MDLESELRKAMAERVAEAAAPPSLVHDVRRRHRRRVTRIRVSVGVAAAAVAVAAVAPGYQSFRANTVGSHDKPDGKGGTVTSKGPARTPAAGIPEASPTSGVPTVHPRRPVDRDVAEPGRKPSGGGGVGAVKVPSWVTFLPAGLTAETPCASRVEGGNKVTGCRWRGPGGWVEIKQVRGTGLNGPEDLAEVKGPAMPKPSSVRGARAIVSDRADSGRQIAWIERHGVGVIVVAGGGPVKQQLMRIAEGVRP